MASSYSAPTLSGIWKLCRVAPSTTKGCGFTPNASFSMARAGTATTDTQKTAAKSLPSTFISALAYRPVGLTPDELDEHPDVAPERPDEERTEQTDPDGAEDAER